ncbi:hypothetical protein CGZ93_00580 [Enemella dayhoffiae]|uniref:Galactosyltransferase C-terminal domain-containing protein n=1 Tax=Enemella dayhoffiae TaxID=2016507 RepID=A0A255HBM4_9ACTN|nr:galactosyltransferase-related protein [Enemella dayhoffiae]OYO25001.1 hypothetical protein CGZ93_00580 [Enemella dayhoffiae]
MREPAVITLATADRLPHLHNQAAALQAYAPQARHVVVTMGAEFDPGCGDLHAHVARCEDGLPLSAARNLGVQLALAHGHDELVLLDVDCLPTPALIPGYQRALRLWTRALLCGPVSYLPQESAGQPWTELVGHRSPHPGRPDPSPGELVPSTDYDLFWSLSFACSASTWRELGGFSTDYVGYGGEDTDFARLARAAEIPLVWVGGADAVHQWHPTSSPPRQHLHDIVRNAEVFHRRWGEWPMLGWLRAFEAEGALRRTDRGWELAQPPNP